LKFEFLLARKIIVFYAEESSANWVAEIGSVHVAGSLSDITALT
jgi:hypothetical protein